MVGSQITSHEKIEKDVCSHGVGLLAVFLYGYMPALRP
jgi:hypothetical protein